VALEEQAAARCAAELVPEAGVAEEGVEGADDLGSTMVDALDVVEGDVDLLGRYSTCGDRPLISGIATRIRIASTNTSGDDVQDRVLGHRREPAAG
jgi:hypothetical protein